MLSATLPYFLSYLAYLSSGLCMLAAFTFLYWKATPIDEFKLIREHGTAAAYSFGGALIGFALTLASSAMHQNSLENFVTWGALALLVQILAYIVLSAVMRNLKNELIENNVAIGIFVGAMQMAVGVINAGSLS